MHQNFHLWILSISLSIGIISTTCVLVLPLFPSRRDTNDIYLWTGILGYVSSGLFLVHEIKFFARIKSLLWFIKKKLRPNIAYEVIERNEMDTREKFHYKPNYLALVFYSYYAFSLYLMKSVAECHILNIIYNVAEFAYSSLLLIAINSKNFYTRNNKLSYFGWSLVIATCFGTSFKFIVEEVVRGYIEIVKVSFEDPEYGLDTGNFTSSDDYLDSLFKSEAKCYYEWISELFELYVPFSTEYFFIGTFYSIVLWKNLNGNSQTFDQVDHHLTELRFHAAVQTEFEETNFTREKCLNFFTLTGIPILTCISIFYFYDQMSSKNYGVGNAIFIFQQILIQLLILSIELFYYFLYFRNFKNAVSLVEIENIELKSPSQKFQLDVILLIFPLFPLGILLVLRLLPYLIHIVPYEKHSSFQLILTFSYIFLSILNWAQVTFQSIFISDLFCLKKSNREHLKSFKSLFLLLAGLNFSVWMSWTTECKFVTIHGLSYEIYGVVEWVIITYATVPFIVFCYAHSTACFVEISIFLSHLKEEGIIDNSEITRDVVLENELEFSTSLDGSVNY